MAISVARRDGHSFSLFAQRKRTKRNGTFSRHFSALLKTVSEILNCLQIFNDYFRISNTYACEKEFLLLSHKSAVGATYYSPVHD